MGYTINKIQDEMNAAGSHWWDRDTLRYFGCRVSEKVYQGEGGVYFVTSEKSPFGHPRAYSVRQYHPDTKDIDTVGDFNALTRGRAHREAAQLAGPAATITQSAHVPTSAPDQLATDICRGGGRCNATFAAYLIRLSTSHHKMMEDYCSIPNAGIYDDDGEPTAKLAILLDKINKAANECLCGVELSGDPRGCTVKLTLPSGESNGMGRDGWCIPTS